MFSELNSSRNAGMAACGIAPSEIKYILDFYLVEDQETRSEYYNMIRALDNKWLELTEESNKQTRPKKHANSRTRH